MIDLGRLVRRVVAGFGPSKLGNPRSRHGSKRGVPRVEADERMLREAITNLCLNALEILEENQRRAGWCWGAGYDAEQSLALY